MKTPPSPAWSRSTRLGVCGRLSPALRPGWHFPLSPTARGSDLRPQLGSAWALVAALCVGSGAVLPWLLGLPALGRTARTPAAVRQERGSLSASLHCAGRYNFTSQSTWTRFFFLPSEERKSLHYLESSFQVSEQKTSGHHGKTKS